jgi:hypothetical protein
VSLRTPSASEGSCKRSAGRLRSKASAIDLLSQALAKIERGHTRDLEDALAMVERGLVDPEAIRTAFDEIEPQLYRFPSIDPADYRQRVAEFLAG